MLKKIILVFSALCVVTIGGLQYANAIGITVAGPSSNWDYDRVYMEPNSHWHCVGYAIAAGASAWAFVSVPGDTASVQGIAGQIHGSEQATSEVNYGQMEYIYLYYTYQITNSGDWITTSVTASRQY